MSPFLLDAIPIWAVFAGLILIFLSSVRIGIKFGYRRRRHADTFAEKQAEVSGAALAAMLTLIGFLLAFTYSLAGSHFDNRRQLVIDDANVIFDAVAGTELLQEPYRSKMQRLLVEYVDFRPTIRDYEHTTTQFDEFKHRSEQLIDQMLVETNAAANKDPTPVVATFVNTINSLTEIHSIRTNLRWNRIPPMIFLALAFLSMLAMFLVGFIRGLRFDRAALLSVMLLVITYAIVFALVIDLDRPANGIFSVSQQPMIELRDSLHSP